MFPARVHYYEFAALNGTPDVLDFILNQVPAESPVWDARPDPERFTIREVLAHIADWEPIFLERLSRTAEREQPLLQGYDEGQFAIDRDYAHSDPHASLKRFRQGRETLIAFLRSQPETAWARVGIHSELGPITMEGLLALIIGHDGYHTAQIVQWLQSAGK